MEQYQEWHEGENMPIKCPIHNCIITPKKNQLNYRINQMKSSNYTQSESEIYPSPRQVREEIINNNEYNYNFNNNNYDYPQYYYQSKQQYSYSNKYNNNSNNINNQNSSLRRYESSDGVLRGYTNNYSFYVSGSSQVRPKITINNKYNNDNINYNCNYNQISQIRYTNNTKNDPSPQRVEGQFKRIYYSNNNNNIRSNRQMSHRNNSYIIQVIDDNKDIYAPHLINNFLIEIITILILLMITMMIIIMK